jgi:hypothetical protein
VGFRREGFQARPENSLAEPAWRDTKL